MTVRGKAIEDGRGADETRPHGLRLRCPNCHTPIDVGSDDSLSTISCPSCGSVFSLIGDEPTCAWPAAQRNLAHFELLEQVGLGQFGAVWKARDTLLDRLVAIKIPRRGALSTAESEFFFRDARAAAQLRHPNIVSVHEVGRDGETVYIATDFIDGANLQEWLRVHHLTTREAAALLVTIAEAVHHAHTRGVIHRDLKPGNILLDAQGTPHVADFGLAKRDSGEVTMTVDGHILGTPAYMSPEQARGEAHSADARSDVYSLGVMLFELLTGERPFRGEKRMLVVQIIHEEAPSPRKFNSHIARDLETITLKCLEKDPAKRYSSAQEMADDLRRHLHGEPVLARPIGRMARAWRWCKRNPGVAGLAAAVAVLLAATAVVSTSAAVWILSLRNEEAAARAEAEHHAKVAAGAEALARGEAVRAKAAETQAKTEAQRADAQAQVAMQVSDFLAGMFQGADPVGLTGNTRTASSGIDINSTTLDILKQGAARVQQDTDTLEKRLSGMEDGAIPEPLAGELAIQAKLLNAIGNVYTSYMRFDDAEPLLLKSLALRRRLFGADHADVAETLHNLSVFRFAEGDFEAAEEAAREAVRIRREKLDTEDLRTAASEFMLAWIINFGRGQRHAEAQQLMERVIATRRAALGDEDREVALARLGLSMVLFKREDSVRAANEVRMAAEVMLRSGVDRRLTEAIELVVQALLSRALGNVAGSVELNERAVAKLAEVLGPQHPAVTYLKREVALALDRNGLTQRAEQLFRESLEVDLRNLGERPLVGRSIGEYAAFLHWHHRFDEAAEQFAAALEILQKRMSRDSADVGEAHQRIGSNELLRGNYVEARREIEESVRVGALWQPKYGPADLRWSLALLGRAAAVSGDREAYGRSCRQLIDTVNDPADLHLKRGIAYQCLWLPQSLPDLSRPVALAKEAIGVDGAFPSTGRAIHAAALYRAASYQEALVEFNTCIAEQPAGLDFIGLVFLAMTHERLGEKQQAERRLAECEQWMTARLERKATEAAAAAKAKTAIANGETPPTVNRPPPLIEWDETVLYKLMLDEAKGLIGRDEIE